jgi:hypothetical protein
MFICYLTWNVFVCKVFVQFHLKGIILLFYNYIFWYIDSVVLPVFLLIITLLLCWKLKVVSFSIGSLNISIGWNIPPLFSINRLLYTILFAWEITIHFNCRFAYKLNSWIDKFHSLTRDCNETYPSDVYLVRCFQKEDI